MRKILCIFVFLLIGQSALSFAYHPSNDFGDFSRELPKTEDTTEITAASNADFSAGIQKNLFKTKIISRSGFSFNSCPSWPTNNYSEGTQDFSPSLTISKIIFPFHSFL